MNSVKSKIKHAIFVAMSAKRNNLPFNITSFLGIQSEMEYRQHFILLDLFEKFEQSLLLFTSQGVSERKLISLEGKATFKLGMAALNCSAMAHHFNPKIMLSGGLRNVALDRSPPWKSATCTRALCQLSQDFALLLVLKCFCICCISSAAT